MPEAEELRSRSPFENFSLSGVLRRGGKVAEDTARQVAFNLNELNEMTPQRQLVNAVRRYTQRNNPPQQTEMTEAPFAQKSGDLGVQALAAGLDPLNLVGAGTVGKAASAAAKMAPKTSAAAIKGGKMAEVLRSGQAPAIPVPSVSEAPILPRMADTRIAAAQAEIPRLTPMGKVPEYNERSVGILRSPRAARAVDSLIEKGRTINPELENWYGSEPLRQFALNEGLSPEEFNRMMAQFSSASQRSPVLKENLMGSHMWGLDRQGLLTPEKKLYTAKLAREGGGARGDPGVIELPTGMGSLAQTHIFDRAKRLAAGAKPEETFGEKLQSYYQNKLGNEMPVTVDVNAVKGPVISAQDPDWLKTMYVVKDAKGNEVTRRQPMSEFASGKLKMREAKDTPGLWIDAPDSPGEYRAFEELWRRGADRAGVSPAGAQALGWYGSADVTALQTKPKTYMELLEQSARAAAARQGVTPVEAMRRAVRGEKGGQLGFIEPKTAIGLGTLGAAAYGGKAVVDKLREREREIERAAKEVERSANRPRQAPAAQ